MKPNAEKHNPEPAYIRELIDRAKEVNGISQNEVARRIGVTPRSTRLWVAGQRTMPYTAQFTLEALSDE